MANLRLIIPGSKIFKTFDYGTSHTFKIYNEDAGSGETAFDASSYTGYVKIFASDSPTAELVTEISPSWTTQSSGIGTFAFTSTNNLNFTTSGMHDSVYVEVQLEKAGTILSTERCKITVVGSPTGTRLP